MNPNTVVYIIAAIGVGMLAVGWGLATRKKLRRFVAREDLSEEQLFGTLSSTSSLPREIVIELWREVAESLEVPSGRLRPDDRFDSELAPAKGWEFDDQIAAVCLAAEKRARRLGAKVDLEKIHTLRDYIEYFGPLEVLYRQKRAVT